MSAGGKLHMELRMKRGRGYVSADKNFDEDLGIGWIPIDSVHSPVKKVNYLVEGARIGQTTDYDKLTLEVWTNGSVTPRDAVSLSAKLVRDHLNIFVNLEDGEEKFEHVCPLAKSYGAALIVMYAQRLPRGTGFQIHFEEISTTGLDEMKLNQAVESVVRRCPEQYLWGYNRYKVPAGASPP